MDWIKVALGIIVGIGSLEGIYLLLKSRRESVGFEGEEKTEMIIRIKVWDALKLGFGFGLGMLIFLVLLAVLVRVLQMIGLSILGLPLNMPL